MQRTEQVHLQGFRSVARGTCSGALVTQGGARPSLKCILRVRLLHLLWRCGFGGQVRHSAGVPLLPAGVPLLLLLLLQLLLSNLGCAACVASKRETFEVVPGHAIFGGCAREGL